MAYDVNKDEMTQFKSRDQILAYKGSVVSFYPGDVDIDEIKSAIDKNSTKPGRYEASNNNGSVSLEAK
ncbi:hypothetical protein WR164_03650 [Philodulcilactobacillus myokoensis]|uniref:Uncharacterized protein n=1 Tax=Philodulcilactobacillus myokoensis TaxID=2929573 RepID=A0A9W6ERH1_9LACO|nr:hypothetical protein [Philodulcilactobacillus myokoensis]GLB46386.1 hypothetical protein WR164_03650 [Philodulcilactobacillus myokoensis]